MQIVWTDLALESLQKLTDFLDENWDNHLTDEVLGLIESRINLLIDSPEIGSPVVINSVRKLVIHKFLTVFYELNDNEVKILLIWDNRQDPDQLEKKLSTN